MVTDAIADSPPPATSSESTVMLAAHEALVIVVRPDTLSDNRLIESATVQQIASEHKVLGPQPQLKHARYKASCLNLAEMFKSTIIQVFSPLALSLKRDQPCPF